MEIDFDFLKKQKRVLFIVSGYDVGKVREHVSLAIGSSVMFCLIHRPDAVAVAVKAAVMQRQHPVLVMEPGAAARIERFGMGAVHLIWIRNASGSVSMSGWPSVITDDSTVTTKASDIKTEDAWFTRLKISKVMEEKAASVSS